MTVEIRASTILPARRERVTLRTADGLALVGELALPPGGDPVATLVTLHPLPTHGGMMDSHLYRKAAHRLPALARLAVLRFNTRGTCSAAGCSEGAFGGGVDEAHDVAAAIDHVIAAGLPDPWVVGWSFGTDLALMHACRPGVRGAVLLSPPLHLARPEHLDAWAASGLPVAALVPEFDDYLRPAEAAEKFARIPQAEVVAIEGAKHLWVGERYVRRAHEEIVARVAPGALPLATVWDGPYETEPGPSAG